MKVTERFATVKRLFEIERSSNKMVTGADEIPITYDRITDEWLTNTICRTTPGAVVVSHELDAPDEGTSNRRRIFLKYNEQGTKAGLPVSVFCKATQSLANRYILGLTGCAEGEVHFYNNVRSTLDVEAPVGFFANVNMDSLNSIVVLNDLANEVEFCDHRTEMTIERARSQMVLLAKLHGRFFQDPELGRYQTVENFAQTMVNEIDLEKSHEHGMEMAESVIPAGFYVRKAEIWPAILRSYEVHTKLPRTLIHGDVHLKNWYVAANGEMGLSDWQCCAQAHWSRDLAYTISTALTVENRRAWEADLIRYYLELLAAQGVPVPSFDEAMFLYRQQLVAALPMWTGTLGASASAPDMQPQATSVEFVKRIAHAIDDLDALATVA
jgi:hypothetical protein